MSPYCTDGNLYDTRHRYIHTIILQYRITIIGIGTAGFLFQKPDSM
ncbi:MAG: hypothetical protein SO414_09470 [Bacteroidaceae bacterium]|nr:hypothetical protein [Bacteroidaceae bacterium]